MIEQQLKSRITREKLMKISKGNAKTTKAGANHFTNKSRFRTRPLNRNQTIILMELHEQLNPGSGTAEDDFQINKPMEAV